MGKMTFKFLNISIIVKQLNSTKPTFIKHVLQSMVSARRYWNANIRGSPWPQETKNQPEEADKMARQDDLSVNKSNRWKIISYPVLNALN